MQATTERGALRRSQIAFAPLRGEAKCMKFPVLAAGLVLGGIAIALPANADEKWEPGYYLSEDFSGSWVIVDGPFSSEADCKAAFKFLSKAEIEGGVKCSYEATDPDAGKN
ncbi:MAG: hypothetical protein KGJ78_17675 [Alphaproteobacteria bacterium]|nr:hypothetical protein [Alphaproteobacteria bacterium]